MNTFILFFGKNDSKYKLCKGKGSKKNNIIFMDFSMGGGEGGGVLPIRRNNKMAVNENALTQPKF